MGTKSLFLLVFVNNFIYNIYQFLYRILDKNFIYPFLNDVIATYNGFDKAVVDDENESKFDVLCKQIITQSNGDLSIHTDICMKLMRNLGYFSLNPKVYQFTHDRCNILFNWMYKLIKEKKITDNVINKCFVEYNSYMDKIRNYSRCYYFLYDKIYEPIKVTLLDIFDNNMHIIEKMLKSEKEEIKFPCRKFVCECVNIYKYMNDTYCPKGKAKIEDYSSTCSKLKQFKNSYMLILYSKSDLTPIIPSLDNIDDDLLNKCRKYENKLQLDSDTRETQVSYSGSSLPMDTEGHGNFLGDDTTMTLGNVDSPMRKTITTTIGTFAGASSLLALLYRVNTKFY
ncbi:hypothetical protein PVIIG_05605 [Plasmodium vivax India VII]|uniref:Variable surface protein n=1 Tax=Plasmodium vivax India VII TaxID=1077284 RepID=A0A0J9S3V6_PLAVI|nr:hypothetical protein PVIIG_05605 [Plasmodium vivax India VII]